MEPNEGLSWMTGGPQGSGVDTAATIFAWAAALGGLYVFGNREYYSNIIGKHSYFQVRVHEKPVRSHISPVHLLTTFDAETLVRHYNEVIPGGGIIYDADTVSSSIASITLLDERPKREVLKTLESNGLGGTVGDLLQLVKGRVRLYPLPYLQFLKELSTVLKEPKLSRLQRMVNVMAVSAAMALLDYDVEPLFNAIKKVFKAKAKVAEMNVTAAEKVYDYTRGEFKGSFPFRLKAKNIDGDRILVLGYQAIALGKLAGGCRFQTYYPITPASDESVYLEENEVFPIRWDGAADPSHGAAHLEEAGSIVVMQTEDELAAIAGATGAALAGVRASTATSGPGFSLMAEAIGWAGMNEVPVVITLYQRAGPSTGLPTRHEQGDLRFAIHTSHGESPRIVFASGDHEECFYDAVKAFNYAERYQMPVIHIVDKALANSTVTIKRFRLEDVKIDRGQLLDEDALASYVKGNERYARFRFTDTGISPRAPLGVKGGVFWNTGDEHDEYGHITEDPLIRIKMMEKRMRKLELAEREIPEEDKVKVFGDPDAKIVVVSWGSPKGPILDAMEQLQEEGVKLKFIQVRLLHPLPSNLLAKHLSEASVKVDVEMNYSAQLAGLIREKTGIDMDHHIVKYNGRPMSLSEVYEALKLIARGKALRRVILSHGA